MQKKFVNNEAVPKQGLKHKRFHQHYCSDRHNGIEDCVITLIDSANTLADLRRKVLYWMLNFQSHLLVLIQVFRHLIF